MLNSDRHADQGRRNPDFAASLLGEPGMHCRRRMANQQLRAAKADRELEDLKPVEKVEGFRLLSLHLEREGRPRRAGLTLHQDASWIIGRQQRWIMNARHFGVMGKEIRHYHGVADRSPHAQR